ncbi:hypothetical protein [Dysgonomonas sp. 511]|uniref:hypothetical protein n=1 Tax=Dysgonomonas sp. 511 TaxID=2302930 RepID=UPI0013D63D9D|nr:hypothetical protein [Dysgonomonas sp. 511]NDV78780.1 hypothetical protein [Dysgonomonas sp. 511]
MKQWKIIFICFWALSLLYGCTDDTFIDDQKLSSSDVTPRNLVYAEVVNARENGLIKSGLPTVETGGLIPTFEIVGGTNAEGQQLSDAYMSYVEIANPVMVEVGKDSEGNPIEVINYRHAGTITIAAGNPFDYGDYYFDIKVTVVHQGEEYSTLFPKAFKLKVQPLLPSALIYIPMAQNLVIGSGKKTTKAYMPSGNPNVTFSLGSDTDKLEIDANTGAIWLKQGYAPSEQVSLTPTIIVTNTLNGEEAVFHGSTDIITIVVSSTPVDLPLQEKYFFTPTFAAENWNDGYIKFVKEVGSQPSYKPWDRQAAAAPAASERPAALKNNYSIMNNPTLSGSNSIQKPHLSWVVMTPQKLSDYNYGFALSATMWIGNEYLTYLSASGLITTQVKIMVSTNFTRTMSDPDLATWVDVSDRVKAQISNGTTLGTEFTGLPYPGTNVLVSVNGSTQNDQAKDLKDSSKNNDKKWIKCVLDLEEWKNEDEFTLAFVHFSNFTGTVTFDGKYNRPGRYKISDVYYKATERSE